MSRYVNYSLGLSDGQRKNLAKAYKEKSCLTLRLSNNQLTGDFPMALTQTQVKKIQKAKASGTGIQIEISKTQMKSQTQNGGFLGALAKLALPVVKTVASKLLPALGIGAASALAETGVKKMFGRSVRPGPKGSSGLTAKVPHNKIPTLLNKPYVNQLTKAQKEQLQAALRTKTGTGLRITRKQQTGGFLGMLASLAVPMLAGLLGKGLQVENKRGKGLQVDSVPRPYIRQKKRRLDR